MAKKVEHGFIYNDGYSIRVRLSDNSTAGFPHLSMYPNGGTALQAAIDWTKERAATYEIRD